MMRSRAEQVAGLDRVARRVAARQVNLALSDERSDVAVLSLVSANPNARRLELVYADGDGGYDLWERPPGEELRFVQADLSEDQAVEVLVEEYLRAKGELVIERLIARGYRREDVAPLVLRQLREGYPQAGARNN